LSTIAVVAKELERQLERGSNSAEAVADARLIREQVERCREILLRMAADAGQGTGEPIVPVTIAQLIDNALDGLSDRGRIALSIGEATRATTLHLPVRAVAQALRGVLKNAQQASLQAAPVHLCVEADTYGWRFEVRDRGCGMTPEVVSHAGEPFFTTKPPGQGMGLGLFLTRAVLTRLGGHLEIDSAPARGTTAVLVLPNATPATGQHTVPRDLGPRA